MQHSDRTLRRLLRRAEVAEVVGEELARLGEGHAITDTGGQVLLGSHGPEAGASFPVVVDGVAVGTVNGREGKPLARLLEVLATQDSATHALGKESLERYKELTMLYALGGKIIAAPDIAAIATLICDESLRFLHCDGTSILLLNAHTGRLELAAAQGLALHDRAGREVGDDLVAQVLKSGVGQVVNDLVASAKPLLVAAALHSLVCCPLVSNGRVFGVLLAGSAAARDFSAADLQVTNAMAAQAASAIEVARLERDLRSGSRKPANLIYGVDDRPPLGSLILLGVQHVLIALMSLAAPVLVTLEAGGTRLTAVSVVTMSLLAMGLATLLQIARRGPVGSGFLVPYVTTAIFLGPSLAAARGGGLPLVFGMTILAGLAVIALSQLMQRYRKLFPPEVSGVVVLMVGLSIVPVALPRFLGIDAANRVPVPAEVAVGMLTLGTIVALSVLPVGRLRLYAPAVGIGAGYLAAAALGLFDPAAYARVAELPAVGLHGLVWHGLDFDISMVLPFLVAALACSVKEAGLVISCQKTNDAAWKRPDMRSTSGGLVACGVGNVVSGALGGVGVSIGAGNVGLASATGATSRAIAVVVAAMFVLLAFAPKVTAALALIPSPVMGAGLLYVACHLVVSGTELITSRMLDARRSYVVGLPLLAGAGLIAAPGLFAGVPAWAQAALGDPLALSTICALLLNLLLNAGVSNRAQAEFAIDAEIGDALRRFFERQGASWGARGDVIHRAAPAVTEWCEDLQQIAGANACTVALQFDEFRLVAVVGCSADRTKGASGTSDRQALAEHLARTVARRYGCAVRVNNALDATLTFEH